MEKKEKHTEPHMQFWNKMNQIHFQSVFLLSHFKLQQNNLKYSDIGANLGSHDITSQII